MFQASTQPEQPIPARRPGPILTVGLARVSRPPHEPAVTTRAWTPSGAVASVFLVMTMALLPGAASSGAPSLPAPLPAG